VLHNCTIYVCVQNDYHELRGSSPCPRLIDRKHIVSISTTVKPFVFACLLFRELNETAKLKGVNIDTVPTLIGVTRVGIVRLEFAKITGAKNNYACKIANF